MTAQTSYSELAEFLANRRKTKKLSLSKVSKALFIPVSTLEELENPTTSSLAPSQARGLYKRYAKYLQVTDRKLAPLLPDDTEPKKQPRQQRTTATKTKSQVVLSRVSAGIIVGIMALIVASYAVWQAIQLGAPPELVISQPQSYQVFTANPVVVEGNVDSDVSVLVGGDPVTVDDTNHFKAEVYLQSGYNLVEIKAINNFSRENVVQLTLYLNSDDNTVSIVDEQG